MLQHHGHRHAQPWPRAPFPAAWARGNRLRRCSTPHPPAPYVVCSGGFSADEGASEWAAEESVEEASNPRLPGLQPVPAPQKPSRTGNWALRSVLKVFVNKVEPNYAQPWQKRAQRSSTGSAFVIDIAQRHILSNAHVVHNAITVYVRRPGIPKKYQATVLCIGHQCDLALLTVHEDSFWEGVRNLEMVDVPELQASIMVAGYPVGGDSLSITQGIVSRISMVRYSLTSKLLGIQIDAAINVAGVAFSKNVSSTTDNIGYLIPEPVVRFFLEEYARYGGSFRGVASPGFATQTTENPAAQSFLKMDDKGGAVIVQLDPMSEASEFLQVGDVVTAIEGAPVASDETVTFRDDQRLEYLHLIRSKHCGDELLLQVLRQGVPVDVKFKVSAACPLVGVHHGVDAWPTYFIVGGLVFAPLSLPLLDAVYGRKWRTLAPLKTQATFTRLRENEWEQVVVLVQVLSSSLNAGYKFSMVICESFNGAAIKNLVHLAALVDADRAKHLASIGSASGVASDSIGSGHTAGAEGQRFLHFGLEGGRFAVLDMADEHLQGPRILCEYGIAMDRSEDLRSSL